MKQSIEYIDYLIINEIEAEMLTGININFENADFKENLDRHTTLKIGNANAWFNLHNPTATGGAIDIKEVINFAENSEQYTF